MSQLPLRSPETDALVSWLTAQSHQPVYRGVKPDDQEGGWQGAPGQSQFVGYHVVHPLPGGVLDGDLAAPSVSADRVWQINSIGADQHQAELGADLILGLLVGPLPPLNIPGRALMWIRAESPPGAARQDPDQPSIWMAFGHYRIATTPLT